MRFGHADDVKPVSITNGSVTSFKVNKGNGLHEYRFMLPNLVARHCYENITKDNTGWSLKSGEATN
jgi:hypothetical protein